MYGELVSTDVINISGNAKEKMLSYFKFMQEVVSVARGRIPSLQVFYQLKNLMSFFLGLKLMNAMKSFIITVYWSFYKVYLF